MDNVGIFYDYLEYLLAICYNLWPFGISCGHLVFSPVLVCLDRKKLATLYLTWGVCFGKEIRQFVCRNCTGWPQVIHNIVSTLGEWSLRVMNIYVESCNDLLRGIVLKYFCQSKFSKSLQYIVTKNCFM
jgi:hypothetical protein